jgi:hypothetical protein
MTGVAKNTIVKLLAEIGEACEKYHDRAHQTLRVTPAMEAGISDHVWKIEEMVTIMSGRQA